MEKPALGDVPYKGLVPYEERDWRYFFGRDDDCERIVANLIGARLSIVYGPIGVGKSSVLGAGASYRVNQVNAEEVREKVGRPEFALATFRDWRNDPIPALLATVRNVIERVAHRKTPTPEPSPSVSLVDALQALTENFGGTLLLVLDQFEDYFLYHESESGAGTIAGALTQLFQDTNPRVHVMISIREDALAQLDRFKSQVPDLFASTLRIQSLDRARARAAIEKPVDSDNQRSGLAADPVRLEPELADAVLDSMQAGATDVGSTGRGRLETASGSVGTASGHENPLIEASYLQLVMTRLWEEEGRLGSRVIRLETFRRLGGAIGIVQNHLDQVLGRLAPPERRIAEEALTYLVTPFGTRAALEPSFLAGKIGYSAQQVAAALDHLAGPQCRVVRKLDGTGPAATRYQVFHDSIARAVVNGCAPRIKRRRRGRRLTALAALLILAAGLMSVALWRGWRASLKAKTETQTRLALSRKLGLWSTMALDEHFDRALLLGVEALRYDATWEARDALLRAVNAYPGFETFLRANEGRVRSVAYAPDGLSLAAGYASPDDHKGGVVLWDVGRRERLGTPLAVEEGVVGIVTFAPDGQTLAAAFGNPGGGGGVVLWDVGRRERLGTPLTVEEGFVASVAFSPDGRTLAAGFAQPIPRGGVVLWDVGRRERLGSPLEQFGWLVGLAFAPDGRTIATGYYLNDRQGSGVALWDVGRRESLGALSVDGDRVGGVAFSPDGRTLAAGYTANDVRGGVMLWDVGRRERLGTPLTVDEGAVSRIAFSPGGRIVAAGYFTDRAGGMLLWDLEHRERLGTPLKVDLGAVSSVAFAPDGRTIAAGYVERERGGVVLWDVARSERLATPLKLDEGTGGSVAFSPDGRIMAAGYSASNPEYSTTNHGGGVVLWDVARRDRLGAPLNVDGDWVGSVTFALDGRTIAAGYTATDRVSGVVLWDAESRQRLGTPLTFDEGQIESVAFTPDGRTIATGYAVPHTRGGVVLWDVGRRERLGMPLNVDEGMVQSVAFAPDGRTIAAGYARSGVVGGVVLWDAARRERLGTPLTVDRGEVKSVAFAPDGRTIAAACARTGVVLWDVARRERLGTPLEIDDGEGMAWCVAFAPDGRTIAAGCYYGGGRGGVVLWDIASRQRLGTPLKFDDGTITTVAFAPDGRTIAIACSFGHSGVVLWDVDPDSWVHRAVRIANRNLSWAEWQRYLGPDIPYRRTIPNLPDGDGVAEVRQAQAADR